MGVYFPVVHIKEKNINSSLVVFFYLRKSKFLAEREGGPGKGNQGVILPYSLDFNTEA